MPIWSAPKRPAEYAEEALLSAILDGTYPPGSVLPGERDLAAQLGITRTTLRETLQRLDRDGWIVIRHGKSTTVNDYWRAGGLNVLNALVRYSSQLPPNFVPNLLEMRLALAPVYTAAAVARAAATVVSCLDGSAGLEDTAEAFASFDWHLQHSLTVASGNPVYTLILNGFAGFYEEMARRYFARAEARATSRAYYGLLTGAARAGDVAQAEQTTRSVMEASIKYWHQANRRADSR